MPRARSVADRLKDFLASQPEGLFTVENDFHAQLAKRIKCSVTELEDALPTVIAAGAQIRKDGKGTICGLQIAVESPVPIAQKTQRAPRFTDLTENEKAALKLLQDNLGKGLTLPIVLRERFSENQIAWLRRNLVSKGWLVTTPGRGSYELNETAQPKNTAAPLKPPVPAFIGSVTTVTSVTSEASSEVPTPVVPKPKDGGDVKSVPLEQILKLLSEVTSQLRVAQDRIKTLQNERDALSKQNATLRAQAQNTKKDHDAEVQGLRSTIADLEKQQVDVSLPPELADMIRQLGFDIHEGK